jgi:hypothetical protein
MATIHQGFPRGQTPPHVFTDFEWIRRHEAELLAKYGEGSILVFHQRVIGSGKTYQAALDDARQRLADEPGEFYPVHQWLRQRPAFTLVRPAGISKS